MAIKFKEHTKFNGGISPYQKIGIEGSYRFSSAVNIHQDPNFLTLAPKSTKISSTTVTGLCKWMIDASPYSIDRYATDGGIYKITNTDTVSLDRSAATIGNGSTGQGLEVYDDFLYYATASTIGRKGKLSGTPSYNDDFLSDGTTNVDQSSVTTGQTYTLPTSIVEADTDILSFVPTRDPLKAISVYVDTKGTGDFMLTLHDANNNSLGSVTVVTADITAGQHNTFTFSSQVPLIIGNTYHFHLTVSTGTSKVATGTASDLNTVVYKEFFSILYVADFHPMKKFLNYLCIGNKNYLAIWDRAIYNPNVIAIEPGYEIRSIARVNEYLVLAAWKGESVATCEDQKLFFWSGTNWDGISSTNYDFSIQVSMGFPHFVHNKFNKLLGMYGSSASLNLGNDPFQQIQDIPTLASGKYVEIYPGAVTEWQTKTYIGVCADTDDTSVTKGIYEYGSLNAGFSDVMNLAFIASSGNTGTHSIGFVYGIGDSLFFSWRSGSKYGIDKVTKSSTAAAVGSWESLIFDDNVPQKQKMAKRLVIRFLPLASGEFVIPKYKIDRESTWQYGTTINTVGEITADFALTNRFYEIEYGFDLYSDNGTFPKVLAVYFEYDENKGEIYSA